MNIIKDIVRPADELYRQTGNRPKFVFVPRWRKHEMYLAVYDACDIIMPCDDPVIVCDFHLCGLDGKWWDRDYIEYRT